MTQIHRGVTHTVAVKRASHNRAMELSDRMYRAVLLFDYGWRSLKSLVVINSHSSSRDSFSNEAPEQMSWLVFGFGVWLLPGNAPQGLNALDCGIFYVLKGQAARNSGPVHGQTDLHWPGAGH